MLWIKTNTTHYFGSLLAAKYAKWQCFPQNNVWFNSVKSLMSASPRWPAVAVLPAHCLPFKCYVQLPSGKFSLQEGVGRWFHLLFSCRRWKPASQAHWTLPCSVPLPIPQVTPLKENIWNIWLGGCWGLRKEDGAGLRASLARGGEGLWQCGEERTGAATAAAPDGPVCSIPCWRLRVKQRWDGMSSAIPEELLSSSSEGYRDVPRHAGECNLYWLKI